MPGAAQDFEHQHERETAKRLRSLLGVDVTPITRGNEGADALVNQPGGKRYEWELKHLSPNASNIPGAIEGLMKKANRQARAAIHHGRQPASVVVLDGVERKVSAADLKAGVERFGRLHKGGNALRDVTIVGHGRSGPEMMRLKPPPLATKSLPRQAPRPSLPQPPERKATPPPLKGSSLPVGSIPVSRPPRMAAPPPVKQSPPNIPAPLPKPVTRVPVVQAAPKPIPIPVKRPAPPPGAPGGPRR